MGLMQKKEAIPLGVKGVTLPTTTASGYQPFRCAIPLSAVAALLSPSHLLRGGGSGDLCHPHPSGFWVFSLQTSAGFSHVPGRKRLLHKTGAS